MTYGNRAGNMHSIVNIPQRNLFQYHLLQTINISKITREVCSLSAAGDPLPQDEEEEEVASGEAESQFPLRIPDPFFDVGKLM